MNICFWQTGTRWDRWTSAEVLLCIKSSWLPWWWGEASVPLISELWQRSTWSVLHWWSERTNCLRSDEDDTVSVPRVRLSAVVQLHFLFTWKQQQLSSSLQLDHMIPSSLWLVWLADFVSVQSWHLSSLSSHSFTEETLRSELRRHFNMSRRSFWDPAQLNLTNTVRLSGHMTLVINSLSYLRFSSMRSQPAHKRGGVYCVWPITDMDSLTDSRASYFTTRIKLFCHKNQRRTNTWSRIKETQSQLLNAGRTDGKTSGIVSMCKLQRRLVAFGKNISRDHDIITCVNEINNSRPRDLNLLFTNKTSGREEDSWWDTFESQDVSSMKSFSLTHTVSEDTHWLWGHTHCLTDSEDTHTVSEDTHSEDTHCLTVSEDTHCLTDSEDTHCLTVSLTLRTHTVSEDTHCVGNLWHH